MKRINKLVVASFAVVFMLFVTPLSVSAEVTNDEQRIVTALVEAGVPDQYVTLAKQHLARVDCQLESAAIDQAVAYIKEAGELVSASSLSQVLGNSTQANRLTSLIVNTGNAVGVSVAVNLENLMSSTVGGVTLSTLLYGSRPAEDVIRNTGGNFTQTLVIAAGLVTLLGATTFVAKKKELF